MTKCRQCPAPAFFSVIAPGLSTIREAGPDPGLWRAAESSSSTPRPACSTPAAAYGPGFTTLSFRAGPWPRWTEPGFRSRRPVSDRPARGPFFRTCSPLLPLPGRPRGLTNYPQQSFFELSANTLPCGCYGISSLGHGEPTWPGFLRGLEPIRPIIIGLSLLHRGHRTGGKPHLSRAMVAARRPRSAPVSAPRPPPETTSCRPPPLCPPVPSPSRGCPAAHTFPRSRPTLVHAIDLDKRTTIATCLSVPNAGQNSAY